MTTSQEVPKMMGFWRRKSDWIGQDSQMSLNRVEISKQCRYRITCRAPEPQIIAPLPFCTLPQTIKRRNIMNNGGVSRLSAVPIHQMLSGHVPTVLIKIDSVPAVESQVMFAHIPHVIRFTPGYSSYDLCSPSVRSMCAEAKGTARFAYGARSRL